MYLLSACTRVPLVPESFNNVGGDSGPAFMRIGLPGEGDSVFGHLRHYRLLGWPWKLDELRNSGHWRNSILCYRSKTKTPLHANNRLILICTGCILCSDKEQHWQGAWFLAHRCLMWEWQAVKCNRESERRKFQREYLWRSTSHSSSTPLWHWMPHTCTSQSLCPVKQQPTFETNIGTKSWQNKRCKCFFYFWRMFWLLLDDLKAE